MGRVIVLGSLNVDLEVRVKEHPHPGDKVMGESLSRFAGGKGANQAVAARRSGAKVHMVGAVGSDEVGRLYLDRLSKMGIQLHVDRVAGENTGQALITTDESGTNEIVVIPGANLRIGHRPLDAVRRPEAEDVLLTQLEISPEVVSQAVRQAKGYGWRVVINLAPYMTLPADVIAAADPLIVREKDLPLLEADGLTCESMVITRGKRGASWGDVSVEGTVVPEDEVVDTLGAGDAFCGALAAALSQGASREQALHKALDMAAESVRYFGSQPNPAL